jgi:RES domain
MRYGGQPARTESTVPPKRSPGPHPEPPPDFAARDLPLISLDAPWYRIYDIRLAPLHFGRTGNNRFDCPYPRKFGVLYLAATVDGAFIETFGHETGNAVVAEKELRERGLARVGSDRKLRLVNLTGKGLARLGADNRLGTCDIRVAQRWSRALHNHPQQPDGILYRSRHDPDLLCAAVFERVQDHIAARRMGSLFAPRNTSRVGRLLRKYDFRLIP